MFLLVGSTDIGYLHSTASWRTSAGAIGPAAESSAYYYFWDNLCFYEICKSKETPSVLADYHLCQKHHRQRVGPNADGAASVNDLLCITNSDQKAGIGRNKQSDQNKASEKNKIQIPVKHLETEKLNNTQNTKNWHKEPVKRHKGAQDDQTKGAHWPKYTKRVESLGNIRCGRQRDTGETHKGNQKTGNGEET